MIPWESQTINTLAENFLWEKNTPVITVLAPGIYQVAYNFSILKLDLIDNLRDIFRQKADYNPSLEWRGNNRSYKSDKFRYPEEAFPVRTI
jgi:hypothetical protein